MRNSIRPISTTRRSFLKAVTAAGVAPFFPRGLFASERELLRVSVLHTTDLHGHILPTSTYEGTPDLGGFARCATQIRAWKAENPSWILLDAGDVFQGTEVGLRTRGRIMAKCFNALDYDAWAVGNHEFDWGIDALAGFVESSAMPALSANSLIEGRKTGLEGPNTSLGRIRAGHLKKCGGITLGVVGLTTPGLPYWFQPEFTKGFVVGDPALAAIESAATLRDLGADAIVLLTHMGMRPEGDDFANQLEAVARAVPDAAVIIAGHTHRDIPSASIGNIPYTQAGYHGIYAGRADLFFDPGTRKLIRVEPTTVKMTAEIPMDPAILSLAAGELAESEAALAAPAGVLVEPLRALSGIAVAGEVERLIGTAIRAALAERGVRVDGVLHGRFSKADLPAGPKSVGDTWKIIPYENFVLTADLTLPQLFEVMNEVFGSNRAERNLIGLRVKLEESGSSPRVAAIEDLNGNALDNSRAYRIAMNTYDASSAGQRLMRLRSIVAASAANSKIHHVQTREALIRFLSKEGGVSKADLLPG